MKKKIVTVLLTAALGSSMLAGQAVMAAETTIKTTETTTATETADAEKATEEKIIGVKPEKDTEGVFSMKLKNLTGKAITEVTVKNEKDEKYPDNFLEKDDKFVADEERTLWFDPNAAKEAEETAEAEAADAKGTDSETSEETEIPKYDMQITFEDATTAVLHTLPFGDTEEAELHLEGEVAYLVFDSTSLKKSINTKETEQALAPKPTEAPVQQSSSQTQDYSYNESYNESYDDSYDYDYSYDYDESYDDYDGSYDNDDYDDSGDSDDGGSDDGCLDDALLN